MDKIILKDFCDKDIPIFKKWLYMPHISKWYNDPLSWINEVEKRKDKFPFLHHFIVECNSMPIGFCQFYEYILGGENWHGNTDIIGAFSIDYLIGDIAYLGKGYAKVIVNALIEKIKKQNNAKKIIVKPELKNKKSYKTLLSCGFCYNKNNEIYILSL